LEASEFVRKTQIDVVLEPGLVCPVVLHWVEFLKTGVHPVVVSRTVGHKRVELAPEAYDRANMDEKRQALGLVGKQLLPNVLSSGLPN
jgi:hypothetical protein